MLVQTNMDLQEKGFCIHGNLVFLSVSDLLAKGNEQISQLDVDTVQIDLSGIERIDSAGIALLLAWKRECLSVKKNCQFQGATPQAMSLIETYQLQSVLL